MTDEVGAGPARVAVLGAGLVGASMAALFAAGGHPTAVWDPAPGARPVFERRAAAARAQLAELGLSSPATPVWRDSLAEAVAGANWIQECAPESAPLKRALYAEVEAHAPPGALIASATSGLTWDELAEGMARPERLLTAHPFNPAHLMPLVELFGPDAGALDRAEALFRALGKVTIRLRRAAPGHVANRLASALWREAVHIVAEGIADVAEVDAALVHGPGLRWSIQGAHLSYHLGGGEGGLAAYLAHLGPSQERRWASLGAPRLTPEVAAALVRGVEAEAAGRGVSALEAERDRRLIAALRSRRADG